MSDWREQFREAEETKRNLLIGGGAAVAILALMFVALPGDEVPSSRGFNLGGSGGSPREMSGRPFLPKGQKTGLDYVGRKVGDGPSSVKPGALPGSPPPPEEATAEASSGAAGDPTRAPGPSSPAAPAASSKPDPRDAASLPKDPAGLNRLGAKEGLLSAMVAKVMEHPAALRYLLNNKTLVDAYFSRDLVKKNCSSGSALKSYLMDSSNPHGVSEELGIARSMLRNPEAASAALGSEFGKRLMDCPAVGAVAKDPGSAMVIVGSNPALMSMLSDPNASKVMNANPNAASLLGAAQSGLGGSGR